MDNKKLVLTLIQADTFWQDINRNLEYLRALIGRNNTKSDVIILPEMFTTGFSMDILNLAEEAGGTTFQWMRQIAHEYQSAVTGSIIFRKKDKFFNRLLWINPDGEWFSYDKRHLFKMGNENQFFEPGELRTIINYKGWRICPLICYDLRFPVWSRNNHEIDLLIYVANWPAARNHVWNILLQARAIENQCFVAGVNRVGKDGLNIHYIGNSSVIHPKGYYITEPHEPVENLLNCSISLSELHEFRKKFPVLDDADDLSGFFIP